MRHSVLICEIRDIRVQKLFHALPWMIEDQRRFVFHAFVTLGCERRPRQLNRHVLILNPAATVRCERCQVIEGKTLEISRDHARQLLADIDVTRPVRIRDKAIFATLIYTAARAAAVASLRVRDLVWDGTQYSLRFAEKGGMSLSIPVRHDLQIMLLYYLSCLGESPSKDSPLFCSVSGRTANLTTESIRSIDICRLMQRRLADSGLPIHLSPHSCRVATVTDLLNQVISLEDVQFLAGHNDPRTTWLYDRRQKQVTRNTAERISIRDDRSVEVLDEVPRDQANPFLAADEWFHRGPFCFELLL